MSDNLPFEIQMEIIKRLPVKSLIQFRSVSKIWKSLIDSSHFIALYSSHHTQVQHLLVKYVEGEYNFDLMEKYVLVADDDTFLHQKVFPTVPPVVSILVCPKIIGCTHGLLCSYGFHSKGFSDIRTIIAVIWNLSIKKAVPVVVPDVETGVINHTALGFGVCRATNDPKIVKINHIIDMESISCNSQVEVFTLSTRVWRNPYNNLPRKSIKFDCKQVVVDGFLYWLATDDHRNSGIGFINLIVSFDLSSEEFREVNLPDTLAHQLYGCFSIFKLRESLAVVEHDSEATNHVFSVWMMEDDSFTKRFTFNVNALYASVWGFRTSGEPIIEIEEENFVGSKLVVYEPYTKQIDTLEIYQPGLEIYQPGWVNSVYPYMESLLLLDQPNFTAYTELETRKYLDDLVS